MEPHVSSAPAGPRISNRGVSGPDRPFRGAPTQVYAWRGGLRGGDKFSELSDFATASSFLSVALQRSKWATKKSSYILAVFRMGF